MVLAHSATAFRQHFNPWIIKNMDLETIHLSGIPKTTKNLENVSKVGPGGHPKCNPKSIKIEIWTSRCLLCVPTVSWITKMLTQGTKMSLKVSKMSGFGNTQ
jgi:hypothetical protein